MRQVQQQKPEPGVSARPAASKNTLLLYAHLAARASLDFTNTRGVNFQDGSRDATEHAATLLTPKAKGKPEVRQEATLRGPFPRWMKIK